jgi:hypothetical protein
MYIATEISWEIFTAVALGGLAAVVVLAILLGPAIMVENTVSRSKKQRFGKEFFKGAILYTPTGMLLGGLTVYLGLSWWAAPIVVVASLFILGVLWRIVQQRKNF